MTYRTVEEARAAGLEHPGCRHRYSVWIEGISRKPEPQGKPEDYEQRTQQRSLERQVRAWKRREAAGDPKAPAYVKKWQKELRDHVEEHGLKRRYDREQLVTGKKGVAVKAPAVKAPAAKAPAAKAPAAKAPAAKAPAAKAPAAKAPAAKAPVKKAPVKKAPVEKGVKLPPAAKAPAEGFRPFKNGSAYRVPTAEQTARWKRARDVDARKNKIEYNPDSPLDIYGNMLSVTGTKYTQSHLQDLEAAPQWFHEALAGWFRVTPRGGIYVGDGGAPSLDDLGYLKGVQPRGWPPGSTWDNVGGLYRAPTRVVAAGDQAGSGAVSTILHESSHALDGMTYTSSSPRFKELMKNLERTRKLSPYFTEATNPRGWSSECFAEGFSAWVKSAAYGADREAQRDSLCKALTGNRPRDTSIPVLDEIIDHFEETVIPSIQTWTRAH